MKTDQSEIRRGEPVGEWTVATVEAMLEEPRTFPRPHGPTVIADAHNAALAAEREKSIRGFVSAILHGNFEHRSWLLSAGEACIAGKELPKCPCLK